MSIDRVDRKKGAVYRVRWRDERGQKRSRSFDRKRDADAFEAKVTLAKRRGDLEELDAGKQRLEDFLAEWWRLYAEPRLAPATLRHYRLLREKYILPRLGHVELRRLKPAEVQRFQTRLAADGVGPETIRKTLVVLQGALERAVEWGRIPSNPLRVIRKPPQRRKKTVRALPPAIVEALRARLHPRDATLVSLLAYAGLRPGEALALRWGDVRESTLLVERALSLGEVKGTKTGKARTVRLLKPLATDLAEWRMACGRPDDARPLFTLRDGRHWTESAFRNWRRRVFDPAAQLVALKEARPYDLRHSYASLLFVERLNPAEIAEEMGHSLQTLLGTYTHVIEELRGEPQRPAEDVIREARERSGPQKAPGASSTGSTA